MIRSKQDWKKTFENFWKPPKSLIFFQKLSQISQIFWVKKRRLKLQRGNVFTDKYESIDEVLHLKMDKNYICLLQTWDLCSICLEVYKNFKYKVS